jgi:hypothetical protein
MNKTFLKQIFWDIDEKNIGDLSDENIIKRSFSFGTLPIIQNMFSVFDKKEIQKIFLNMNPRTTTEKRYNFFKTLLNN